MPAQISKGLAFFPGAVKGVAFGEDERAHIEPVLRHQNAYDSADILSSSKPAPSGIDLATAPVLADIVNRMTELVGVKPQCVHLTTRQGGQTHPSHSDKMGFDVRAVVHLGADVLLQGRVDRTKSTGDVILSGGDLQQPLRLLMRSGDLYITTKGVLHAPYRHGVGEADQAAISMVGTWTPGSVFSPWHPESRPLTGIFPSLGGVSAVDGRGALEVTTPQAVPGRRVAARVRAAGHFTEGSSLFRAPADEQSSAYHWLGVNGDRKKKSEGGTTLRVVVCLCLYQRRVASTEAMRTCDVLQGCR